MKQHGCLRVFTALLASVAMLGTAAVTVAPAQAADENPDVMLGVFKTSNSDGTDTLYMSTDGINFKRLSTVYQAVNGNNLAPYRNPANGKEVTGLQSMNDPGLIYKDNTFYVVSGYSNPDDGYRTFCPVFGASADLKTWTYQAQVNYPDGCVTPTVAPPVNIDVNTDFQPGQFNPAGPEAMTDDDGSVWVVTSLGYYGYNHGHDQHDIMKPYIMKISNLQAPQNYSNLLANPTGNLGALQPINLPDGSTNFIDPALYKENGVYYLSIKKDGQINQLYSINDLNRAGDASAWRLVDGNVSFGYEGPSLTKFKGLYRTYMDKLDTWGINVTTSNSLGGGWSQPTPINAVDENGNRIPTRHGSVITVTDPAAKAKIWDLARSLGYKDDSNNNGNNGNGGNNGGNTDYGFIDVDSSTPHSEDIIWLAQTGISAGWEVPGGRVFRGMDSVKRQDMAAFLYRLAGRPSFDPSTVGNPFSDVNPSTPHYKEILWLAQTGISTGWDVAGHKEFRGMDSVKRQDMAAFLHRYAAQFGGPSANGQNINFVDVNGATPHSEDIVWLAQTGVSTGWNTPNGTEFLGYSPVVRQDMAAFLHRMTPNA